jgi:hypothetical protein
MNWKLILQLSLFGLAMGIGTVYFIPSRTEPLWWLVIFIYCAYMIARQCNEKYFLHGFLVSVVNSVWITASHIILFNTYIGNHPQEASMMQDMPFADTPQMMMLIMGPAIGAVSGLLLGLFSFIASKIVKKEVA